MRIDQILHPLYTSNIQRWDKWWRCYRGGEEFRNTYLIENTRREDPDEFERRKTMTPIDRDSGIAVDRVKDSIAIRIPDTRRVGGPNSYQQAVNGSDGGVDRAGTPMNAYIVREVLPQMLVTGRFGVYIDREEFHGPTIADALHKSPYIYGYPYSHVCSWDLYYNSAGVQQFRKLLLRHSYTLYEPKTGLPTGEAECYREFWINADGFVQYRKWAPFGTGDEVKYETVEEKTLGIRTIPFVLFSLPRSLMEDIADHQIAILNLASSNVAYAFGANFPLYVEQFAEKVAAAQAATMRRVVNEDTGAVQFVQSESRPREEVQVGPLRGRRYPIGTDAPQFIHPSPEPLRATTDQIREIREGIDRAVGLNLSSLGAKHASADSKDKDQQTLEAGLAAIGLELQIGENKIAQIWAEYEEADSAAVTYPRNYALITDSQRIQGAKELQSLQGSCPSRTFQRELAKLISHRLLSGRVDGATINTIEQEVDDANYVTSDPEAVRSDLEAGIVSKVTASYARGYDGEKEVPIAEKEHAERLARLVVSQTQGAARGVPSDPTDTSARDEKKLSQKTPDVHESTEPGTRG